ncbi:MAG: hypothetical protein ABIA78_01995 [archaeon]
MSIKARLKKADAAIQKHSYLKFPIGILCLIIGFIGGFIPIFQGGVFVLAGCTILFGEKFTNKLKKKFKRKK